MEYVQSTFGKNMYNDFENQRIEEKLCTGKHKESHLLFTKGEKYNLKEQSRELPKKEIKEILNNYELLSLKEVGWNLEENARISTKRTKNILKKTDLYIRIALTDFQNS